MSGLGPAVIALVGTLLGAGLTATVALYTSYATRRHEAEVERRSFERDELKRRRGRQEELYTRFIQAGHDVEVAITQFADANRAGPSAMQIADQIEDFRKLAREVRLFASTNVSERIDDLVESWDQWVSQDEVEREHIRDEIVRRYDLLANTTRLELSPEA
jgi:hypothetical protein